MEASIDDEIDDGGTDPEQQEQQPKETRSVSSETI